MAVRGDATSDVRRGFAMVFILLGFSAFSKGGRCRFPVEWKGRYFQSGLGNVIIRDGYITTKGTCVEQHRDYFLFANREKSCFQCLLMISRHSNVIQYKESFCLNPDSLKTVCSQIRIETPLHTLVRDPATPIPCPFRDAYYFDYNDLQHGFCGQPISYSKPCAGVTKYQFHFKHCIEPATLNGKDLDLECLATWKDGSESYLYTRVTGSGIVVKDDQYRCFNYQHYDNEVYLSMSGDATCRGLKSARDGQFILELTRDAFGWPSPSCHFPDWLKWVTWRDLEGKHTYTLDDGATILSEFYVKRSKRHLQSDYKCLDVVEQKNSTFAEVTIRGFATHGCISKTQCLRFRQRALDAIEIQKGALADYDAVPQCLFSDSYRILIPELPPTFPSHPLKPSVCPHPGYYRALTRDGCLHHLVIGCSNISQAEASLGCQQTSREEGLVTLECVTSWQTYEKTYVILRELGVGSQLANCFSFELARRPVVFEIDRMCNKDVTTIETALSSLTFLKLEECDISFSTATNQSVEGTDSVGVTRNDDPHDSLPHHLGVTQPSDGSSYDDLSDITDHNYDAIFKIKSLKFSVHQGNDATNDVTTEVSHAVPDVRDTLSDPLALDGRHNDGQRDDAALDRSQANRQYKDNVAYGRGDGTQVEKEVKGARIDVWEFGEQRKEIVHIHLLNAASEGRVVDCGSTIAVLLLTSLLQMTGLR